MFLKRILLPVGTFALSCVVVVYPVNIKIPAGYSSLSFATIKIASAQESKEIKCSSADERNSPEILLDKNYYNALLCDISHARKKIAIIMYLFKITGYQDALPDRIVNMLIKKHTQGVQISVLLNIDQTNKNALLNDELNETNLQVAKRLEEKGINVYLDSPHKTTHAKIVIIDDRIVYIGSHNFTQSALKYNHEASVRIVSPALAKKLIDYMEALEHE